MSDIRVTRKGGVTMHMMLKPALKLISRQADLQHILGRLVNYETVEDIPLADGSTATMVLNHEEGPDPVQQLIPFEGPYTHWPVQALAPKPTELMHGHVRILVSLDFDVALHAIDQEHAQQIIDEVCRGEEPPEGFKVIFDPEEREQLARDLHSFLLDGDMASLARRHVDHHQVTGWFEPELVRDLEYQEVP